jgi:hypothetical protein
MIDISRPHPPAEGTFWRRPPPRIDINPKASGTTRAGWSCASRHVEAIDLVAQHRGVGDEPGQELVQAILEDPLDAPEPEPRMQLAREPVTFDVVVPGASC